LKPREIPSHEKELMNKLQSAVHPGSDSRDPCNHEPCQIMLRLQISIFPAKYPFLEHPHLLLLLSEKDNGNSYINPCLDMLQKLPLLLVVLLQEDQSSSLS
jgi:hypothetical protein